MSLESVSLNPDYSFNIAKTDVKLAKNTFFEPGQSLRIRTSIEMGDFPEGFFDTYEEGPLLDSMRSSLAQLAMEAQAQTPDILTTEGLDAYFERKKTLNPYIYITNNSEAQIFIQGGSGLFRLYQRPKKYISGGDLEDLLKAGGVQIDGKEKKSDDDKKGDWIRLEDGIAVKIQEDWRKFLPKQPEVIMVSKETNGDHGRSNNAPLLRDIKYRKNQYAPGPWFGKSVPIYLKTVAAEIDPSAYPGFKNGQPHGQGWDHFRSWILDKEKTNHRVIFELYSPTIGDHMVNWSKLRFGYQD